MKKDYQSSLIVGLALTLGVAVAAFLGFIAFLGLDARNVAFAKLPSRSMEPALLEGDRITWSRLAKGTRGTEVFRRGEIVVFVAAKDPRRRFMKRLIGLPGDTLAMRNAVVEVNGHPLREPYASKADSGDSSDPVVDEFRWQRPYVIGPAAADTSRYVASRDNWGPIVVPPKRYFVLDDLRDQSRDSRYLGFVAASLIVGRVRRVYFSRDDSTGDIRWARIGHLVR